MNINKYLDQKAVYWATPVSDGLGGHTFTTAVEIDVRWEDKQILFVDIDKREVLSTAIVYSVTDYTIGGYFYLGTLSSLSDSTNPKTIDGAREIRNVSKVPSVNNLTTLRKYIL